MIVRMRLGAAEQAFLWATSLRRVLGRRLFCVALAGVFGLNLVGSPLAQRPNILWITSEDNGPYLGCYGDPVARTPRIDALAEQGTVYLNCFSNAAVCAPARQTLISGILASSIGGQHMRSNVEFPPGVPYFPKWLRDAGYYTSNNSKTDYNGGPAGDRTAAMNAAWDDSSGQGHWRGRRDDQPFFSVFNIGDTHESQLFDAKWRDRSLVTDPNQVSIPAYLPDVPEIRLDLARYYDRIAFMDTKVGALLDALEADGLADDTIVFYFSDHGGSLPRGKSFIYDSGTRVPLIVCAPEKWRHLVPGEAGMPTERLVSFVDFAATVLSLAGLPAPDYMQGQAFLGAHVAPARAYVPLFRGRRGERYDLSRGLRDAEYLYLRHYSPHLPVMQPNVYSWAIPSYSVWRRAWLDGALAPEQAQWFEPKSAEALYRVSDDPDNIHNLATDPAMADVLARFRDAHREQIVASQDSVFYPEGISGREYGAYGDKDRYPLARLAELADRVSEGDIKNIGLFRDAMSDPNPCVRWWAVTGCVMLGPEAAPALGELEGRLADPERTIRIQAAKVLAMLDRHDLAIPVLVDAVRANQFPHSMQAALAVDEVGLEQASADLTAALFGVTEPYATRVVDWMFKLDPQRSSLSESP